jgi:thiol-disulfide isomerase/thioredoxin
MGAEKHFLIFFVVMLISYERSYSQDSSSASQSMISKISLTDGQIGGAFDPRYIQLNKFTYNELPQALKGSVDSLDSLYSFTSKQFYYSYFTSTGQRLYLQFLRKRIDSTTFVRLSKQFKIDTAQLSKIRLNDFLYFFIGTRKNGDALIFIDVNNNKTFSDDSILVIKKEDSLTPNVLYNRNISNVELYYGGTTYKVGVDITLKVGKFHSNVGPGTDSIGLLYKINNYKTGYIDIAGHRVKVLVKPGIIAPICYNDFSDIAFGSPDPSSKTIYNHIGDTVYLYRYKVVLSGISILGDSLEYKILGNTGDSKIYGPNPNNYAYDFKLEELNSDSLQLYRVLNNRKYVLLDFWGTWCHPCLEAMPRLKEFYTNSPKMDSIVFVGVCVDDLSKKVDVVRKARSLGLPWANLLIDRALSFSDPSSAVNLFKVAAYPTYILIAPDGKIVARCTGEAELETMLNSL